MSVFPTQLLYVAATDAAEARTIAEAVAAGRCGHREHHETREAAERIAGHLNRLAERDGRAIRRTVFPVEVRTTTTHDGRIRVARLAALAAGFAFYIAGIGGFLSVIGG